MDTLPPPALDTWALVRQAQAGDTEAFATIYRHYHPRLLRLLVILHRDADLAEDVTAETFLRLLGALPTLADQGFDLMAWLTRVAKNIILDRWKSAHHNRSVTVSEVPDQHGPDNAAALALAGWVSTELWRAVAMLPPRQAQCVQLRFGGQLSVREVAAVMGVADTGAKTIQHRAMRNLRDLVSEDLRCTWERRKRMTVR